MTDQYEAEHDELELNNEKPRARSRVAIALIVLLSLLGAGAVLGLQSQRDYLAATAATAQGDTKAATDALKQANQGLRAAGKPTVAVPTPQATAQQLVVPGPAGRDGRDGVGSPGPAGSPGPTGATGKAGRGVLAVQCTVDGWVISYSDGTEETVGACLQVGPSGPPGPAGTAGTNGKDGRDGTDGENGADGKDAQLPSSVVLGLSCTDEGALVYTDGNGDRHALPGVCPTTDPQPSSTDEPSAPR